MMVGCARVSNRTFFEFFQPEIGTDIYESHVSRVEFNASH